METDLMARALDMAVVNRQPPSGLISHSDRGSQYTSAALKAQIENHGIQASMSAKGCCYDNAVAESFFHTLKVECVYRTYYATRAEAQESIFDYLATFYNAQRRHSTLNYMSPDAFEKAYYEAM